MSSFPAPTQSQSMLARRVFTFAVAAGIPLVLALDNGGYDIVTRDKFGLVVWAVLALGLAFGVLPRGRPTRTALLALGALGAFAGLTALALIWTETKEQTFNELARVLQYGGLIALAYAGLNRHTWRAAAAGLAAAALFVPLLSLTARLAPDTITDETIRAFGTDRLSYPFGYWNAVACWGAMAFAIGLAWSAHARLLVTRALTLAVLPAVGLTIYLSYSRAGAAAVTIAVLAALAFGVNRWTTAAHALVAGAGTGLAILAVRNEDQIAHATGSAGAGTVLAVLVIAAASCAALAVITKLWSLDDFRLSPRAGGIATVVTVLAAILIGFTVASEPISNGWDQFRHERTPVATNDPAARLTTLSGNRYDAWTSAIHAFHTDEWGGIGPGSFEFFWARDGDPQYARDAHSLYLENLAELGIPGLLVVIALLAALLTAAVQARVRLVRDAEIGAAAGAIAAFVVFLFFAGVDWMWELSAIGALALGGIAVAGTGGFMRWGRGEMPVAPRVALVVVAVACAVLQVPGLSATERLRDSGAALDAGDLERAKSLADDAADAEPWATSPLMQRAVVEQSLGDFASARKDLDEAVSREPMNWRLPFLLADLEAAEGHPAAVRRQLEELRRLAPHSVFLLPGSPERRRIDSVLGLTSSG